MFLSIELICYLHFKNCNCCFGFALLERLFTICGDWMENDIQQIYFWKNFNVSMWKAVKMLVFFFSEIMNKKALWVGMCSIKFWILSITTEDAETGNKVLIGSQWIFFFFLKTWQMRCRFERACFISECKFFLFLDNKN